MTLTNKLRPVTAWYELGLQLEVPSDELERIEIDFTRVDRRMSEVLKYWWRNCPTKKRSWHTIANALKIINYKNLAKELEDLENVSTPGKCRHFSNLSCPKHTYGNNGRQLCQ